MDNTQIEKFEKLLDKKLSQEELDRLQRIKNTLKISENDALWDIIIALEYQKKFYEEIPEKLRKVSKELTDGLGVTAEKQTALAQAKLVEEIKIQAKKISLNQNLYEIIGYAAVLLFGGILYGAACMWAGFSIGSGETHPPPLLLKMPVGFVMAGMALVGGCGTIYCIAKAYADGQKIKKNLGVLGLGLMAFGAIILRFTF